jgi:hypothetical protein
VAHSSIIIMYYSFQSETVIFAFVVKSSSVCGIAVYRQCYGRDFAFAISHSGASSIVHSMRDMVHAENRLAFRLSTRNSMGTIQTR